MLLESEGDADRARDVLEKAIGAAAPGGWIRPFAEPGASILELLPQLQPDICESDFLHRVEDGIRSCQSMLTKQDVQ